MHLLFSAVRVHSHPVLIAPAEKVSFSRHSVIITVILLLLFISCRFWYIPCRIMSWPWNRSQRSLKVIESGITGCAALL